MYNIKSLNKKIFSIFVSCVAAALLLPVQVSAASQIRITEIMYDPSGNGDKEFIEFYNGSNSSVSLGGWSTFGVDFIFPSGTTVNPGTYITIARNSVALRTSHPSARIAGQYGGKLRGSGELIKLINSSGQTVSQVSYSYGGAWPSAPRNGGPSLSLIRATGNEASASCWAPSASLGGSPGVVNSIQGGFGGGCADVAYYLVPTSTSTNPQPSVAQTQTKVAQEAKKQEAVKKAEEQKIAEAKAEEQKQQEIKAAEAKATKQAKIADQAKSSSNRTRWVMVSTAAILLAALGFGTFIILNIRRKKDVAQILNKQKAKKKHIRTDHAKT